MAQITQTVETNLDLANVSNNPADKTEDDVREFKEKIAFLEKKIESDATVIKKLKKENLDLKSNGSS